MLLSLCLVESMHFAHSSEVGRVWRKLVLLESGVELCVIAGRAEWPDGFGQPLFAFSVARVQSYA